MNEGRPPITLEEVRAVRLRRQAEREAGARDSSIHAVRLRCEKSLAEFVRAGWHVLEPRATYVHSWHIDCICFPAGVKITTRHGETPIEVVRVGDEVLSFSHRRHRLEWRSVKHCMRSAGGRLLVVELASGRRLRLTPDHPVWVEGRGYVRAREVRRGEQVLRAVRRQVRDRVDGQEILLAGVLRRQAAQGVELQMPRMRGTQIVGRARLSGVLWAASMGAAADALRQLRQIGAAVPGAVGVVAENVRRFLQFPLLRPVLSGAEQPGVRRRFFGVGIVGTGQSVPDAADQMRTVSDRVTGVEPGECGEAVFNLEVAENNNYFAEDVLVHNCEHLEAVTAGLINRLMFNVPPGSMKSLLVSVFWNAWEWGPKHLTSYRTISTTYAEAAAARDCRKTRMLIQSDWYQRHWPHVELIRSGEMNFENSLTGWREGVAFGSLTGKRGDRLVIDDPHSVEKAESKLERERTVRRFREGALNRLNDQEKSAIVVIMQRLHEADIAGEILSSDMGYAAVVLPMEYESSRHCATEIGFSDPRSKDGELLCPQRFPLATVASLKRDMGNYVYCTPAETPILMGDLSMKPISEVREGDEVVGIDVPAPMEEKEPWGRRDYRRKRLRRAFVTRVMQRVAPVVRITLSSGRVIRCTPDHRWMDRRGGRFEAPFVGALPTRTRPLYRPAALGSVLLRICDPTIQEPQTLDDAREAGWLAGFFDGEGSVSVMRNRATPHALITFTQGAGRNLALCERLEAALRRFGFDFGFSERVRSDRRVALGADAPKQRHYWLRGLDLPEIQKFLHVIQPHKWRERMIEGALGAHFVIGHEHVKKIEPDGEEKVFALTTTTGNYVAWGLASANCGQYQQRPAPRGGGIFPYNAWEYWAKATAVKYGRNENQFPDFDFILGSVDSAFTTKEENDFTAMCVVGVWADLFGASQIMLMHFWRKRLRFHEAVEEIVKSANKMKCDRVLIENKAAGISIFQEISRLTREESFALQLVNPGAEDKQARAYSVSHLFREERDDGSIREGVVWVPAVTQVGGAEWPRAWAEDLMQEMASFPKGAHDDGTDACVHALRFLRNRGLVRRRQETAAEEYREILAPLNKAISRPLYPT